MQLEKVTKRGQIEENGGTTTPAALRMRMDLLGERWAMLVLRELAYGPRRFSGLKADLPGISANVLTPAADRARSAGARAQGQAAAAGFGPGL